MTRAAAPEMHGASAEADRLTRTQSRARSAARWTTAFDLLLLIGGLIILHMAVSGPIPSGGDGGNWLALAREALGEDVMAAAVVYEPVFIGMLSWLLGMFGPVNALLVAALITEAVLVGAVYLMVSKAGRLPALVSAVLVGAAGYRLEAYAWGAYPQMLAIGLGLLTVWAAARYVSRGRWGWLVLAGLGVAAVLATHKLVGGLLVMAIPAMALHTLWLEGFRPEVWRWAGLAVLVTGVIGAFYAASWLGASAEGVEPTLNPLGLGRAEHLLTAFEEATVPWIVVTVVALIGFGLRAWVSGAAPVVSASFGWVLAAVVGFVAVGEPRIIIQAQVALLPAAVLVTWRWWRERRPSPGWRRFARLALGFMTIAILGSVVLTGLHRYDLAADWYRVVGQREIEALGELRNATEPGDVAIASKGPNGNPIGWWVQGYAGIPTVTSIDPAFLAFPDEREQAAMADRFFGSPIEGAAASLEELGARFVVLDRRGSDVGWAVEGPTDDFDILLDGTILILMTPPAS